MKVLFLSPRLDCSFKQGEVPKEEGPPNHPIRIYWQDFVAESCRWFLSKCDEVHIEKRALWQFDKDYVTQMAKSYDVVFVPHKQKHDFDTHSDNVFYYMQTVFPFLFTVDNLGWGANMSWAPLDIGSEIDGNIWERMQIYTRSNKSKFEQPEKMTEKKDYVLFTCQIPHDETIKYHSDVSVFDALKNTLEVTKALGEKLIVKGHPMNPHAMEPLRRETFKYFHAQYVDDVSLKSLIQNSKSVVTVNSGTGMEAMLYNKPIFIYGRSEYDKAVIPVDKSNFAEKLQAQIDYDLQLTKYKYFMTAFFNRTIEIGRTATYEKVYEIVKDSINRRHHS